MNREIKKFESFEEQEMYFLHFMQLTPSEQLQKLADLQKKNFADFIKTAPKKITVSKQFLPMDIEHPEFITFLKCADQNELRYMCIGGYAVNYHGYHPTTEDMDIWIAPTNDNKKLFLNTLLCMGYAQPEIKFIRAEDFTNIFYDYIRLQTPCH